MGGQAKGLASDILCDASNFNEDSAGLDDSDVVIGTALARAHPRLGRFLGYRLIREGANPDLATPFDIAGGSPARGFNLTGGDPAAIEAFETVLAKGELR